MAEERDTAPALAGRFAIEGEVGRGGMGTVFRARDAASGRLVAVKLLRDLSPDDAQRFARESAVLAGLDHPAIVGYVAHGIAESGQPYLAMQWLEGESLAQRLEGGRLSAAEVRALLLRAAEGLAHAHERRVLHRDIKPSNLFLPGGDPARAMLVDFGVARWIDDRHPITTTGALVGTPSYMAPEQARGSRQLDPRTDLFALGCVAYRCLTGVSPFQGENLLATLFRILFEEPAPPGEREPSVPAALDELVTAMISKDPAARPRDAGVVAAALRAQLDDQARDRPAAPGAITVSERGLLSVVLVRRSDGEWRSGSAERELRAAAGALGGRVEQVADGSALVLFAGLGGASDQAQRAARCALEVRAALPGAAIAVASGRAALTGRLPVGELIERAVQSAEEVPAGRISVDEATAGLLDGRFVLVAGSGGRQQLRAERDEVVLARTVLGKATAMVGRERELATLEAIAAECAACPVARAVVITAPAGAGKSRLRQELVRRVVQTDQRVEVLLGRGDPLRSDAAFALLGDALRRTAGITTADSGERQRSVLAARVARHMRAPGRAVDFLGALLGLDLPDIDDALRAARGDHLLRYDQMRAAWLEWLDAEASDHPVVFALEDLHWGDRPTVDFVDAALAQLAERPILVVALARPELRSRFPDLWERRDPQHMRLAPLQKKASSRLVRDLLGDQVSDAEVSRIVDHSTGNPLFLEELVRAAAGGQTGALPDSVLLMLQARLDHIDPELRRVLRAASIFGESFSPEGVQALLGEREAERALARLAELRAAELVLPRSPAAERDDTARPAELYAFRHALVRDAAYATFTDEDRALGHRLAAGWLERRGDAEPAVLAEHYARGGRPQQAVAWFAVGADAALAGGDMAAALDLADRALALGAAGAEAGRLHRVAAEAHNWRGEPGPAADRAEQAIRLLPRGSTGWFVACDDLFMASGKLRRLDRARAILMEAFAGRPLDDDALTAKISGLARAAIVMIRFGSAALGAMAVRGLEQIAGDRTRLPASVQGRFATVYGLLARASGDAERCIAEHEIGLAALQAVEDRRSLCYHLCNHVSVSAELGDLEAAERSARTAVSESRRLGLPVVMTLSGYALGALLVATGRTREACPLLEHAVAANRTSGEVRMLVLAATALAEAALADGDLARAREMVGLALDAPDGRSDAAALAMLARIELARGDLAAAERQAAAAVAVMPRQDGFEAGESSVRRVAIEVLERAGRLDEARERAGAALARLAERAGRLPLRWRRDFLCNVENAPLLAAAGRLAVDLPDLVARALA